MKDFLTKAILFFILTMVGLAFLLLKYGYFVDYFYEKFTTPKQTSLILGDSRSMQGIQPRIINQELKNEMNYFWKKYDDTYSNRHDSCNQYSSCRYIFGFPGQMVLLRGY